MSANVPKVLPSMIVPVVDVRVVDVGVGHRLVPVRVAVRFAGRVVGAVFVPVVFVVDVAVVMLHRLVPVFVFVPLRQVQPDADPHERRRNTEADRKPVLEDRQRQ